MHNRASSDRTEYYTPTDEPTVYYNDEEQTIVIEGEGVVDYYDVVISSIGSRQTMCATTVNGISDTIDISTLPAGDNGLDDKPISYEVVNTNHLK